MRSALLALLLCPLIALAPIDVGLLWDKNPETNVVGYRIYFGRFSRQYDGVLDVGMSVFNEGTVPVTMGARVPVIDGITNFFAVTAYDTEGLESGYSAEVTYFWPPNLLLIYTSGRIKIEFNSSHISTNAVIWFDLYTSTTISGEFYFVGSITNREILIGENESQRFFKFRARIVNLTPEGERPYSPP